MLGLNFPCLSNFCLSWFYTIEFYLKIHFQWIIELQNPTVGSKVMTITISMLKIAVKFCQSLRRHLVYIQEHRISLKSLAKFQYNNLHILYWASKNCSLKLAPNIKRIQILDSSPPLILKPKIQIDMSWPEILSTHDFPTEVWLHSGLVFLFLFCKSLFLDWFFLENHVFFLSFGLGHKSWTN